MSILIISHPRSGSTRLLEALSDVHGLEKVYEPFNIDAYNKHLSGQVKWIDQMKKLLNEDEEVLREYLKNKIVKTQTLQNEKWLFDNADMFDRIIFLCRDNIRESFISIANAQIHGWQNKYYVSEDIDYNGAMMLTQQITVLFEILKRWEKKKKVELIWYNDLYTDYETTKKTLLKFESRYKDKNIDYMWDNYFKPELRLRQDKNEND